MEKGKMAVRMCLVFVVMAAVFIGIFYYYKSDSTDKTYKAHNY